MSYFFLVWNYLLQKYSEEVVALIIATCILLILKILTTITYKKFLFFRVKISTKFVFINIFLIGLIILNTQIFLYSLITLIIIFNLFYFFLKKFSFKKRVFQRMYENIHWNKLMYNFQLNCKSYVNNLSAEYISSEFKQKGWRQNSIIGISLALMALTAYFVFMKYTVLINFFYACMVVFFFYMYIIIFIIPFLYSTISYKYYIKRKYTKKKFCYIKSIYEISKNFTCFALELLLEIVIIISIAISQAKQCFILSLVTAFAIISILEEAAEIMLGTIVYFDLKIFDKPISTIIFIVIIFSISYFTSYIYIRIYAIELERENQGVLELSKEWLTIFTLVYSILITIVCYKLFIISLIHLANEELMINITQITKNSIMHNSYIDIIKDITTNDLTQDTETQGRKLTLGYEKLRMLLYLSFGQVFWTIFLQSASIFLKDNKKEIENY